MPIIKVSVIIPVYNAEVHLQQCLESVVSQTLKEIEIICVDDGSTDGSVAVLTELAQTDSRIHILQQRNQFAGIARNRGIQMAQGEYLAFLDADDFFHPSALEELYTKASAYQLDMVKGRFEYIDVITGHKFVDSYAMNSSIGPLSRRKILSFDKRPKRLLNVADVPWNGLYRRSFLLENQIVFNNLICSNDHSFFVHCLLCAKRLMVIKNKVACYRVNQSGSLIGKKANHYGVQLESYKIVRVLCTEQSQQIKQIVLQQELNGVFFWYFELRPKAEYPDLLDTQIAEFLENFDEEDVSKRYLKTFKYCSEYHKLRYNKEISRNKEVFPLRLFRCWQEHGLKYIIELVLSKYKKGNVT